MVVRSTSTDFSKDEGYIFHGIGRCIYCGRDGLPLADEHIVPLAISGHSTVFRSASCKDCETAINRFEQPCLKHVFEFMRHRFDSPSRNLKDRPKTVTVRFQPTDEQRRPRGPVREIAFPSAEAPAILVGWRMPDPGVLMGRSPTEQILGEPWFTANVADQKRCFEVYQNETGDTGPVELLFPDARPHHLIRLMAKIAHAWGVAHLGYDESRCLLVPLILGRSKHFNQYVGGMEEHIDFAETFNREPSRIETSQLTLGEFLSPHHRTKIFDGVAVRLFGHFGGLNHLAVIGSRDLTPDEIALMEQRPSRAALEQLLPERHAVPPGGVIIKNGKGPL